MSIAYPSEIRRGRSINPAGVVVTASPRTPGFVFVATTLLPTIVYLSPFPSSVLRRKTGLKHVSARVATAGANSDDYDYY